MKSMAIVIRDDSYDKILTPLVFAYLASAEGTQVDMLFVNWAVKALTVEGAASLCMDGRHAADEVMVRENVAKAGLPNDIYEIIKALKSSGCVNFYACSLAGSIFGVNDGNLIPEAEGIVGASWFLNDKRRVGKECRSR